MKPYPSTSTRFDIDAYLNQQLAQQAEEKRLNEFVAAQKQADAKFLRRTCTPACMAELEAIRESRRSVFRNWAVRLNARIERWMDSVDWVQIDIKLGTFGGIALTGFIVYMAWVMFDAWLQGRFNLGVN